MANRSIFEGVRKLAWCGGFALACIGSARAELVPQHDDTLPDLRISSIGVTGTSGVTAKATAASVVSLELGFGKSDVPDLCEYNLELGVSNAGPGSFTSASGAIEIGVWAKFPDGVTDTASGTVACAPELKAGKGCAIKETLKLASGTTKLKWTIDPQDQVDEYSDTNNVKEIELVVPSPCNTNQTASSSVSPVSSLPSRDSLKSLMQLRGARRPITVPVTKAPSAPTRPDASVKPGQAGSIDQARPAAGAVQSPAQSGLNAQAVNATKSAAKLTLKVEGKDTLQLHEPRRLKFTWSSSSAAVTEIRWTVLPVPVSSDPWADMLNAINAIGTGAKPAAQYINEGLLIGSATAKTFYIDFKPPLIAAEPPTDIKQYGVVIFAVDENKQPLLSEAEQGGALVSYQRMCNGLNAPSVCGGYACVNFQCLKQCNKDADCSGGNWCCLQPGGNPNLPCGKAGQANQCMQ